MGQNLRAMSPDDKWIVDSSTGKVVGIQTAGVGTQDFVKGSVDSVTGGIGLSFGGTAMRLCGPRSVMWIGDSLTQTGGDSRHPLSDHNRGHHLLTTFTNINASGGLVRYARVHPQCPLGNGTLRYYAATDTFTWQAFGDTEGAPVSASTGFITAQSGSPNATLYLACLSRYKPTVNTSDTLNVAVNSNSGITRCNLSGFTGWAELLLGCPFDVSLNYGISGATTSEMWAFASTWQSVVTEVSVIHLGTNQTSTMSDAQQSIIDLENIIRARLTVGSKVVVCTLFPTNSSTATQAGAKEWHRQETMRMCKRLGVPVADGYSWLADPVSTLGAYRATDVTSDGLHLSGKGAYIFAKRELVPILQKIIQAPLPRPNAGVVYDASLAPYGNLLTNGNLTGIAGTKGTRVTGDFPTSWTAGSMGGGTVATCVGTCPQSASPVARDDGRPGNWLQLIYDNTTGVASEGHNFYQSAFVSGSNYAVGDYVTGEIEFRFKPNNSVGANMLAFKVGTTSFSNRLVTLGSSDSLFDLDGDTISVIARSFPMRVETGESNLNFTGSVTLGATGTADLRIGHVAVRKAPAI